MKIKRRLVFVGLACVALAAFAWKPHRFPGGTFIVQKLRGKASVADRLVQFGPKVQARWQPFFNQKNLAYPPQKLLLVGFKKEKQLQVYASGSTQTWTLLRSFPIQKLSGRPGPKLRFGDFQVPEGFYRIESLNPNSAYHLALRVNYPNRFDRAQAEKEGRTNLGGDIMIHGSNVSVGCLAMGDEASEDLFVLAAQVGAENIEVILSPVDFRKSEVAENAGQPVWVKGLYAEIKKALLKLPR